MRRGQQLRRTESQSGPIRSRRHRQQTTETPPPPLRRSLRLSQSSASLADHPFSNSLRTNTTNQRNNPNDRSTTDTSFLQARATEAESTRSRQRSRVRESRELFRTDNPESTASTRNSRGHSQERAGPRDSLPELPGREEEISRSQPATPVTPVRRIIRARQRITRERAMASESSQERTYAMEFAIPPPRAVRAGEDINPPLAVRVRIRDAISDLEISGEDELSYLFVAAALYDEGGGMAPIAPPDSELISGRLSGSLELLNEYHEGYEDGRPPINDESMPLQLQQGSFALFSSLRINRPGNYRIGITLLRVGGGRVPAGCRPRSEGGMSLAEVMSETICVHTEEVPETPLGFEAKEFLHHLRYRGYDVPSPS